MCILNHFNYYNLQKKKQAVEEGKEKAENTIKEGNDILNEANDLANKIILAVEVSIMYFENQHNCTFL